MTLSDHATPPSRHHVCSCVFPLCVCSVVTQLHDQDSLDLILASSLIWKLIRAVHLCCLITLICLVSVRL